VVTRSPQRGIIPTTALDDGKKKNCADPASCPAEL
jgi:hypothetical protein